MARFLTPKEVDNLVTRLATFWNIPAPHYELVTRLQRASCHEAQMKSEIFSFQTGTHTDSPLQIKHFSRK